MQCKHIQMSTRRKALPQGGKSQTSSRSPNVMAYASPDSWCIPWHIGVLGECSCLLIGGGSEFQKVMVHARRLASSSGKHHLKSKNGHTPNGLSSTLRVPDLDSTNSSQWKSSSPPLQLCDAAKQETDGDHLLWHLCVQSVYPPRPSA